MAAIYRVVFLLLLALTGTCDHQLNIDLDEFSRAILLLTNDTLGVVKMEVTHVDITDSLCSRYDCVQAVLSCFTTGTLC